MACPRLYSIARYVYSAAAGGWRVLDCILLHFIVLHCIVSYSIVLYSAELYCFVLNCIVLYFIVSCHVTSQLMRIALHFIILDY